MYYSLKLEQEIRTWSEPNADIKMFKLSYLPTGFLFSPHHHQVIPLCQNSFTLHTVGMAHGEQGSW